MSKENPLVTFSYLKHYDGKSPEHKIYRKRVTDEEYTEYLGKLSEEETSIERKVADKFLTDDKNSEYRILIEMNKFPYNLDRGITQYVIWVNPMYDVSDAYIREVISKKIKPVDFALYRQDPRFGSAPDMDHYHLFVRNNEEKLSSVLGFY
jgi:hypothetical protein